MIAVIGSEVVHSLDYLFVLLPVGLGAVILLTVGLVVNNLGPDRRYAESWL